MMDGQERERHPPVGCLSLSCATVFEGVGLICRILGRLSQQVKEKSGNFLEIENKLRNFAMSIKNSKVMVKKNEEESPRALKEKELESVNGGGGGGGNRKKRKYEG
jgi:hypothetical protein